MVTSSSAQVLSIGCGVAATMRKVSNGATPEPNCGWQLVGDWAQGFVGLRISFKLGRSWKCHWKGGAGGGRVERQKRHVYNLFQQIQIYIEKSADQGAASQPPSPE
jgi:hypothetical protein